MLAVRKTFIRGTDYRLCRYRLTHKKLVDDDELELKLPLACTSPSEFGSDPPGLWCSLKPKYVVAPSSA